MTARRRPLKPCASAGCQKLIRGDTYCSKHQAEYVERREQSLRRANSNYNAGRSESDKFYGTSRWRKLSIRYRKMNPLCILCKERGRAVPAKLVDHIKPLKERPDLATEWSNLRSLCQACHNRFGEKVGSPSS